MTDLTLIKNDPEKLSIHQRIARVMIDLPAIPKTVKKQSEIRYAYRGIDALCNAVQPLFARHGVHTVIHDTEIVDKTPEKTRKGSIFLRITAYVTLRFYGAEGDHIDCRVLTEGYDNSDKGTGKMYSYALKSALTTLLCIPTEDTGENDTTAAEIGEISKNPEQTSTVSLSDQRAKKQGWLSATTQARAVGELKTLTKQILDQFEGGNPATKTKAEQKIRELIETHGAAGPDGKIDLNLNKSAYNATKTALTDLKETNDTE